jgi:hypothetical protein
MGDPNAPVNPGDSGNGTPPSGPGIPGGSPGMQPLPGQFPANSVMGAGAQGGSTLPPGFNPASMPGMPQFPGQLGNPVNSVNPPDSSGGLPSPQPGTTPGAQPNPLDMINRMLTQPRPNGPPTANPTSGNTIGGGIAGFASKLDADSIMTCADHTNYTEWEFIFDPSKWKGPADPRKTLVGTPAGSGASSGAGNFGLIGGPATPTAVTGQNQGRAQGGMAGGTQGGTQGGTMNGICGMEARPGIQ